MIAKKAAIRSRAGLLDGAVFSFSVQTLVAALPVHGFAVLFRTFPMKYSAILFAAVLLASTGFAQNVTELKDDKEKVSYSIGLDIGNTFKRQNMDINVDVLLAGMRDALAGKTPLLNEEQVKETMTAYSKTLMEAQANKAKEAGKKNGEIGQKFLEENKTKEGVKTTASGLQYKVLKEGSGTPPKETDMVETHYRGTLISGKEFDSSYKRNEPTTFPVNRVIKGWTEALQLMKPGSKYQLFIPAELAYGERGAGGDIGPNETLIFEVELLSVKPQPEASAANPPPAGSQMISPAPTPVKAVSASPAAKTTPTPQPTKK
jgi:FKBP-type peptidyl-prolyl cis-trans isomerase FklB